MLWDSFFLLAILAATGVMQTKLSNATVLPAVIYTANEQCQRLGFAGACHEKSADRHKICFGLDCAELQEGGLYYPRFTTIPAAEGTRCGHPNNPYKRCDGRGRCITWNREWIMGSSVGAGDFVRCKPRH